MLLDNLTFKIVTQSTPLISFDIILKLNGSYLLGLRNNRPARGYWFVPGGRIFKDESLNSAFIRVTRQETGTGYELKDATPLGVYEHFYQDNFFDESYSTHYVVLGYLLNIISVPEQLPYSQHVEYKWFTKEELMLNPNVHENTKAYFQTL